MISAKSKVGYNFDPSYQGDNEDNDDDWGHLEEDLNLLQAAGSQLEYSDTSEDYTTRGPISSDKAKGHENSKKPRSTSKSERKRNGSSGAKKGTKQSQDSLQIISDKRNESSAETSNREKHDRDIEMQTSRSRKTRRRRHEKYHTEGIEVEQENLSKTNSRFAWISQFAFSFRSPQSSIRKSNSGSVLNHHFDSTNYGSEEYYSPYHQTNDTIKPPASLFQASPALAIPVAENERRMKHSSTKTSSSTNPGEDSPLLGTSYFRHNENDDSSVDRKRESPRLGRKARERAGAYQNANGEPHKLIVLAAAFLQDYEANRRPTFANVDDLNNVTRYQLSLYRFRFSNALFGFPTMLNLAVICIFLSSALEGFNSTFIFGHHSAIDSTLNNQHESNLTAPVGTIPSLSDGVSPANETVFSTLIMDERLLLTLLNVVAISFIAIDLWLRQQVTYPGGYPLHRRTGRERKRMFLNHKSSSSTHRMLNHDLRQSRSEAIVKPLILFCLVLGLENIARLVVKEQNFENDYMIRDKTLTSFVLFASIFKPIVLFYISSQARDALETVLSITNIVLRVLLMEVLLVLMFASIACRLFPEYESFQSLSSAWLSLFELSTTVNNPSLWMSIYANKKSSALFFITFVIVAVFYLHSLVLSVIFQVYINSAAEIHERTTADREDALYLAFLSLQKLHEEVNEPAIESIDLDKDPQTYSSNAAIDIDLVRETLTLSRPHYNPPKITALVEIVDPTNSKSVDFATFRTQIRHALNASIRTARNASLFALFIELLAGIVGVVNFAFVVMVTSVAFSPPWFVQAQETIGCTITVLAAFELIARFNPFRLRDFTPATRFNLTFDGLAMIAATISSVGIIFYFLDQPSAFDWILMGRAIDMMRAMRFFPIFRDVVRRSVDVVPVLMGPLTLVFTTIHIFCYAGMALWGGAVVVGAHNSQIQHLYDLNNFNSYREGIVTMFQILVVNDWQAVAQVFLFANRCSSPWIVYPFFISFILVGVSIMLNVMTAFFVQSFVTKINDDKDAPPEATTTVPKARIPSSPSVRDISFHLSERDPIRRIATNSRSKPRKPKKLRREIRSNSEKADDLGTDADSETSSRSEMLEFDVYEREGFDKIMQTVTGNIYQTDYTRQVCHYFEVFERSSPFRDSVGYLVCDQQCIERFGNRRFKTKSIGCLEENELYASVSALHTELLSLPPSTNIQGAELVRVFPHKRDPTKALEISASVLRRHPVLTLFISRTIKAHIQPEASVVNTHPPPATQQSYKPKSKHTRKPVK